MKLCFVIDQSLLSADAQSHNMLPHPQATELATKLKTQNSCSTGELQPVTAQCQRVTLNDFTFFSSSAAPASVLKCSLTGSRIAFSASTSPA